MRALRPAARRSLWPCVVAAALGSSGCGVGAQGLVQGVLGLTVSPAPGSPRSEALRGGVALRLERVELGGRTWQQLLASDGRHGWTDQPLSAERPVSARASAVALELMPVPPGDADFAGATAVPVAEGRTGTLLGGSRESQVADMRELMRPSWLNPGLAPWPRWEFGGVSGYAPLGAMALSWTPPSGARTAEESTIRDRLGAWGLEGFSRAPFLAPLAEPLQRHAPREGAPALDLSGLPHKPAGRATLHGAWAGPLFAYRAATAPAGAWAALLGFGQGAARAFRFIGTDGSAAVALANDDDLEVVRIEEADLDGDGRPEWLLEVVGLYGDGYYSELWVVDGRSREGTLYVQRESMSRGPGDNPAAEQDAAWGLNPDRSVWIWRSTARTNRMTQLRYRGGRMANVTAPAALIVLGVDEQFTSAHQRLLQTLTATPSAIVVPRRTAAGLRWLTALPAPGTAEARRRAAQRGLPPSAVMTLTSSAN